MDPESLFEDCQDSIERSHELWKSYFSKWETLAKYEEDVPEDELQDELNKRKKSTEQETHSKTVSSTKNKNCRKVVRKKKILKKRKNEIEIIKQHDEGNLLDDSNNKQLEIILKSVLMNILNANKKKVEMFAVLSQTFSQEDSTHFSPHPATNFQVNNRFSFSTVSRSVCPARNTVLGTPPGGYPADNNTQSPFLYDYSAHSSNFMCMSPMPWPQRINFGICSPENAKLKPLEWDIRHKFVGRVCRKINKEYFIKRSFPEMNITQDGKRFGSLCLRKRTNSVSLSMENSNFITPERKPSERKCFSENVLQRKRRRPSKVFFDNEVEDSESDDQTENRAPIIHSKNEKFKPEIIPGGAESDSDDCESIFDRVKKD